MVRIAGVNISGSKHVDVALTSIYGIGRKKSLYLCSKCKIKATLKMQDLDDKSVDILRSEISKLNIEGDLRRSVSMNIKRLVDLGTYRGRRHRRHLPSRGQRTKTNARTCKGPKKLIRK